MNMQPDNLGDTIGKNQGTLTPRQQQDLHNLIEVQAENTTERRKL